MHTNQRARSIFLTKETAMPWANMATYCACSTFLISMVCSTAVLIGDTINEQANIVKRTENLLKIPAALRLTCWLFTRRGKVQYETTKHKSILWQGGDPRITKPVP